MRRLLVVVAAVSSAMGSALSPDGRYLLTTAFSGGELWVFTGDLSTGKAGPLDQARCSFVPDRKTVQVYLAGTTCELDPTTGQVGPEVSVPPESEVADVTKVELTGLMDGSVVVVDPSGKGAYLHAGSRSDATLWYCEPNGEPVHLVAVVRRDGRTQTALLSRGKITEFENRAGEYRMEAPASNEDMLVLQQALQDPGMGPQQFELRVYRISTGRKGD